LNDAATAQPQAQRILDAAREIIRETGDFDLPMRTLAARARVSLSMPYTLFGSKGGVVSAILAIDQARFREKRAQLISADPIEEHFDSLRLGMDFYASDETFYRALFLLSADPPDQGSDPTRRNHEIFLSRMRKAHEAGLLRPEVDVEAFAEMLTDLFSSGVRGWATNGWSIPALEARLRFGYVTAFAGAGSAEVVERMRRRTRKPDAPG
jgi:AcrR family transcriptional regulator